MSSSLCIGLMSGTSLDGVDGVLAAFSERGAEPVRMQASAYLPFDDELRADLMALQAAGDNEIHRESLAASRLAQRYAACVARLLEQAGIDAAAVRAIGAHGQTIRHRPECGYTRQTNNPALLAELAGIDVIADFRSRDVAAGGQGAPLVPAFHDAMFGAPDEMRVVVNIGGIANISILSPGQAATGFDTGPGNVLMDAWIQRQRGLPYDAGGAWAAGGRLHAALLARLLEESFLALPPPKSTGRDLFHLDWLLERLADTAYIAPADVQATLAAYTATSIADAIARHAKKTRAVYVCGGGACNVHLMELLGQALRARGVDARLQSTEALGVSANHVEALAFAWLAWRHVERQPGNLPAVTGAVGPRILGALYPAR